MHKQSGQAIVTLSGRDIKLGKYGSDESKAEYRRRTAEWMASKGAVTQPTPELANVLTLAELLAAFLNHADTHYRKNGQRTSEYGVYVSVMRPLRRLYGDTPAAEFSPLKLSAVISEMIRMGWARKSINNKIHRIRNIFKWAASMELVPASIVMALKCVAAIGKGRTAARETPKVKAVADEQVAAVLTHVSRQVAAMIQIMGLTAMRPGEVCIMRGCDLDTTITETKSGWDYRPDSHKTEHHDQERVVVIGPRARQIIEPFLRPNPQEFLFSPADAEAERLAKRHERRQTPLRIGNTTGTNHVCDPRRKPRERYTPASLRRAIERACEIAFGMPAELYEPRSKAGRAADTPEAKAKRRRLRKEWHARHRWHPHQCRHAGATTVSEECDDATAQVVLGHASAATTEGYIDRMTTRRLKKAREVMAAIG